MRTFLLHKQKPIFKTMKENKHTKGPWFAVVTDTTGVGNPALWDITCKNGGIIAESIGHNEADANLISAAPDLLDALDLLLNKVNVHYGVQDKHLISVIEKAEMAIAKAKGLA